MFVASVQRAEEEAFWQLREEAEPQPQRVSCTSCCNLFRTFRTISLQQISTAYLSKRIREAALEVSVVIVLAQFAPNLVAGKVIHCIAGGKLLL